MLHGSHPTGARRSWAELLGIAWSLTPVFSSDRTPTPEAQGFPVPLPDFSVCSAPSFPSSLLGRAQPRGSRCFSDLRAEPALFASLTTPAIC